MIGLASAITVYSGSSYSFESEEFEYYTVVGNSSNLEGMNVTWDNGNTTITFDSLFAADAFTLVFFNNDSTIITEHHYSGGGGWGPVTLNLGDLGFECVKIDNNNVRFLYGETLDEYEVSRLDTMEVSVTFMPNALGTYTFTATPLYP